MSKSNINKAEQINLKKVPKVFVYNGNTALQRELLKVMKSLKIYSVIILLMFLGSVVLLACSHEVDELKESKTTTSVTSQNKVAQTICDIIGATVVSSGNAVVNAGSTATYSYTNNTGTVGTVVWSINPNPVGSATIVSSGTTVTVTYSANFISGTLSAAGSGGTAQTCNTILNIVKSGGVGGGDCACPNPVIRCVLAVSGGHPYWRLQLDNLQAGDTYVWSQLHAPFMAGTNNTYVIVNPQGPAYSGFTVYCEVTRICSNGTVKKRKAFYTNYYGGTTTTGTQGFINIGGVCDSNLGDQ